MATSCWSSCGLGSIFRCVKSWSWKFYNSILSFIAYVRLTSSIELLSEKLFSGYVCIWASPMFSLVTCSNEPFLCRVVECDTFLFGVPICLGYLFLWILLNFSNAIRFFCRAFPHGFSYIFKYEVNVLQHVVHTRFKTWVFQPVWAFDSFFCKCKHGLEKFNNGIEPKFDITQIVDILWMTYLYNENKWNLRRCYSQTYFVQKNFQVTFLLNIFNIKISPFSKCAFIW